jgi:hypothetical protein
MPIVGELVTSGMPEHVRVDRKWELSFARPMSPWLSPSVASMVHGTVCKTERAQGARKRAAGARRIAQRACAANITWGHSRGRQQCRLLAAPPPAADRPSPMRMRHARPLGLHRQKDRRPTLLDQPSTIWTLRAIPFCQVGRRVIGFLQKPEQKRIRIARPAHRIVRQG